MPPKEENHSKWEEMRVMYSTLGEILGERGKFRTREQRGNFSSLEKKNYKAPAKKRDFGAKSRIFALKPWPCPRRVELGLENFCGVT